MEILLSLRPTANLELVMGSCPFTSVNLMNLASPFVKGVSVTNAAGVLPFYTLT